MIQKKSEKRKYARLDLKTEINLSVMDVSKEKIVAKRIKADGKDIAVHGIRFATNKKLKKGDIVSMEIFLPDRESPVYVEGEVRWTKQSSKNKKQFEVGINFLTLDEENVLALLKYVGGDLLADN